MAELFPDHWNCYLNKREENEICSWLKQSNSIYNENRGSCTGSPHPIPARQMQGSHLAKLLLVPPGTLWTLSSHSLSMSLAGTFSGPIVVLPLAGTVGIVGGTFCCVGLFVHCKTDCEYSCPHPHPKWRNCRWHEESVSERPVGWVVPPFSWEPLPIAYTCVTVVPSRLRFLHTLCFAPTLWTVLLWTHVYRF